MSWFRSFLLGVTSLVGLNTGAAAAMSAALDMAALNTGPNHSGTVYRRPGGRAHRTWKKARASGINPRVRHG